MSQKIWYLIVAVLVIIIFTQLYFSLSNPYMFENWGLSLGLIKSSFPFSQGKFTALNSFSEPLITAFWASGQCTIPEQDSLISLIHIKKVNGNYNFDCEFGKLYPGASNFQTINNDSVWLGVAKDCSLSTIKTIDSAVRSSFSCVWPMYIPIPVNLTDYYAFTVGCKNNIDEIITHINAGNPNFSELCKKQITNLANLTSGFGESYVGVIDPNTGRLYQ